MNNLKGEMEMLKPTIEIHVHFFDFTLYEILMQIATKDLQLAHPNPGAQRNGFVPVRGPPRQLSASVIDAIEPFSAQSVLTFTSARGANERYTA